MTALSHPSLAFVLLCLCVPSLTNVCFKKTKTVPSTESEFPEGVRCPEGPCLSCEIVYGNSAQSFSSQTCGSGRLLLSDILPTPTPSDRIFLNSGLSTETIIDPCEKLGLGNVKQQTCVTDPETILRAHLPERFQGRLQEVLVDLVSSARVCCCSGSLCNTLPDPSAIDCFHGVPNSPSNLVSVPCQGPCMNYEIRTLDNQEYSAQSCGAGDLPLIALMPLPPPRNPEDQQFYEMVAAGVFDICRKMGIGDSEQLTCVDDPDVLVQTHVPDHFQARLRPFVDSVAVVRFCCCADGLCNTLPLPPLPQPTLCYHKTKHSSVAPNSQATSCNEGSCLTCEIVFTVDGGNTFRESRAQGCGSGPFRLSDLIPLENALVGIDVGESILNDACATAGLADAQQITCIDDPAFILNSGRLAGRFGVLPPYPQQVFIFFSKSFGLCVCVAFYSVVILLFVWLKI